MNSWFIETGSGKVFPSTHGYDSQMERWWARFGRLQENHLTLEVSRLVIFITFGPQYEQ
jgi:hypothetical protein